jgi:hypothetical protein
MNQADIYREGFDTDAALGAARPADSSSGTTSATGSSRPVRQLAQLSQHSKPDRTKRRRDGKFPPERPGASEALLA